MNKMQKIGKIEAICLIVMVTVNEIIFNIPNFVISTSGSSSWITVLVHFTFISILGLTLSKFFSKLKSKDLIDISEYLGRKSIEMDYRYFIYSSFHSNCQLHLKIFF